MTEGLHRFVPQTFIKHLLYASHRPGTRDTTVAKADESLHLDELTSQSGRGFGYQTRENISWVSGGLVVTKN